MYILKLIKKISVIIIISMQSLIANGHYAGEEIQSKLDSLSLEHLKLIELWEQRHNIFNQCHQLQVSVRVCMRSFIHACVRCNSFFSCVKGTYAYINVPDLSVYISIPINFNLLLLLFSHSYFWEMLSNVKYGLVLKKHSW